MRCYRKKPGSRPGSRFSEVNPGPNPGSKNRSRDWDPGPNADPWSLISNQVRIRSYFGVYEKKSKYTSNELLTQLFQKHTFNLLIQDQLRLTKVENFEKKIRLPTNTFYTSIILDRKQIDKIRKLCMLWFHL